MLALEHLRPRAGRPGRNAASFLSLALVALLLVSCALATPAARADGAAGGTGALLDATGARACATEPGGPRLFCWGGGGAAIGVPNRPDPAPIATPGDLGPVDLGPGRTAVAVAVGDGHTCAIRDTRDVLCWGGSNLLGRPDAEAIGDNETPGAGGIPVPLGGRPALAIAAGDAHTCAIVAGGDVYCWGDNRFGQLGYGDLLLVDRSVSPASRGRVDLGPGRTAVAIAVEGDNTCAILDGGDVICWGPNQFGQAGRGHKLPIGDDETPGAAGTTVDLGGGRKATSITVGRLHTCARLTTAEVLCWGAAVEPREYYDGNLGYADRRRMVGDDEAPGVMGSVSIGGDASLVSTSAPTTCVALTTGRVRCWGPNAGGSLGFGTMEPRPIGTPDTNPLIDLGGQVTGMTSGDRFHCVRLVDEQVACWGYARGGRLGDGFGDDPGDGGTFNIGDDETPARSRVRFTGAGTPPLGTPAPPGVGPVPSPPAVVAPPKAAAPPAQGREIDVAPVSGTVTIRDRPGAPVRTLRAGERIPVGAVLDTRRGTVRLVSANGRGGVQTARFSEGVFRVAQTRRSPLTTVRLTESLACRRATTRAAKKGKRKPSGRRVWGDGKGPFATQGQYGTAAVRGTRWLVEDRCDGTLIRVTRGSITARDLVRGGTVTLRAGGQRFFPADRQKRPTRVAPR